MQFFGGWALMQVASTTPIWNEQYLLDLDDARLFPHLLSYHLRNVQWPTTDLPQTAVSIVHQTESKFSRE